MLSQKPRFGLIHIKTNLNLLDEIANKLIYVQFCADQVEDISIASEII